jgi:hypothetical protein
MTPAEMLEHIKQQEERWRRQSEWESVKNQIETALHLVLDRDSELLIDGASERAIAHRIAVYLEWHYQHPDWSVDVEFNRMGVDRSAKEVPVTAALSASPGSQGGARVLPDIIVHHRGPKGPNLLAIELKPADASLGDIARDLEKLSGYVAHPILKYTHAVHLTYHTGKHAKFDPVEPFNRRENPQP